MHVLIDQFRELNRELLTAIDKFHPSQWETRIDGQDLTLRRVVRDAIVAVMLTEARLHLIAAAEEQDQILDLGDLMRTPRVAEHAQLRIEALVIRLWHATEGVVGLLLRLPPDRLHRHLLLDGAEVEVQTYLTDHALVHLRHHLELVRGALLQAA